MGLALMGTAVVIAFNNDSPGQTTDPSPIQLGAAEASAGSNANSTYRLVIPSLSVDAPIVAVHIEDDDGVLGVPALPSEVGWWADGPVPGSDRGTSILAGHVNTADRGPGALREIEQLRQGDPLIVEGWGEPISFEVEVVVRYPRGTIPSGAFEQRGPGRLAVVSCTDLDEETGQYRDNLFVYAKRTGS